MFENIPKNWKKDKLKNYIDIIRGVNYNSNEAYDVVTPDTTTLLRANNISSNGTINFDKVIYVSNKNIKDEQIIKKNDILVAMSSGSKDLVGKAAQSSSDLNCSFGAFCSIVRPKIINPKFIGYYFQTDFYRTKISELSTGININNLRKEYIENLDIAIPSTLEEQQEIVDVLDAADRIISLRTACIESAQDLIPALFQEMFGDPLSKVDKNKIGYYFDVGTGATPRRENSEYYEGNIPWVKTTEVDNCYINSTSEHISESAIKETNCSLYPPGTILMAMYGQGKTRGKVAYLNISATTNQACAALQLKKEYENDVNLIYVFYYLQIIYEFLRTLSQGGGRPNMNLSIVRNIPLYLPDIKQQELFAEKVQEIEEYIKSQQAELENAKTMFQSLLHHAFTGELTRHKFGGDANG